MRSDDDAGAGAALMGLTVEEFHDRSAGQQILGRWFAYDGDEAVGMVTALDRVDDRVFVVHRLKEEAAFAPLLSAALSADLDRPLHLTLTDDVAHRQPTAEALGFSIELESSAFDVPFDAALAALGRQRGQTRCTIATASEVDQDALFNLDVELRNDVPGNDGWRGNRAWFDDEMTSVEFDTAGYVVAVDGAGALVGLCRMWRNDDGPALGMLGVTRPYRSGLLALDLLRHGLTGASEWGWPTFSTHTARPALQRRLRSLGASDAGGFSRLRRPAPR